MGFEMDLCFISDEDVVVLICVMMWWKENCYWCEKVDILWLDMVDVVVIVE